MQVFVPSCKLTLDGLMKTYWWEEHIIYEVSLCKQLFIGV
jgi:hypothetical protein